MPRTLVTGASGFIGVRLVQRLVARGDRVACLVRPTSDTSRLPAGVETVPGSLGDAASLAAAVGQSFDGGGAELVVHLAGLTHAARAADFHAVNAEGTERLARAAADSASPPTLVVVGSLASVGPSPPGMPHTETTVPAPVSHYGRSKLAGELAARRVAERLPVSIVRPPIVFGPGDRDGLMLFKWLRWAPLHFVPQMRGLPLSLVYVDDLVDAILAVGERGERVAATEDPADPRGVYFAADPKATSYADVGRMIAAAWERRVWVLCRRKYPLLPAALVGDLVARIRGKASILGMDKLREASASGWVCDPAKLVDQLGWSAPKPARERYAETLAWYRDAGWLGPGSSP